jgi:hypothetical protein
MLKVNMLINGKPALALIDSGASENFIDDRFVDRNAVATRDYGSDGQLVKLGNGSECCATRFVKQALAKMEGLPDRLDFVVMRLGQYSL